MGERRFLLVDSSALPDVFLKVLQAKELLASGSVSNISTAARQAGISRSAFYKYKDYVFDAETGREAIEEKQPILGGRDRHPAGQNRRFAKPAFRYFGSGCIGCYHHPVPAGKWYRAGGSYRAHRNHADDR